MGIISQGKRLLDALFTRTQRQLLGLFYGYPERSFYLNEIVRLAGVGTGSVQRELARLSSAGLLNVRRIGNQKHYQANPDQPIFADLCALARKTFGVVDVLRQALEQLPASPDLAVIYQNPDDAPAPTLRLLLVSEKLDKAVVDSVLAPLKEKLGREIRSWVLDRRRFTDLLARKDPRLLRVLKGARVRLLGSLDPAAWA